MVGPPVRGTDHLILMHFVHRTPVADKTIAAIATPPGEGGIAIIRISGSDAIAVAAKVFSGPVSRFKSHTVHFGQTVDDTSQKIDDVLLLVMRAPKSFTGEDTVEIHCHGGRYVSQRVLGAVLKAGAAPAAPGEFSLKAFMNGKIDLAQAEAIQGLIHAKNEYAMRAAQEQLEGVLSHKIRSFQQELTKTYAILEAWVDFPEEDLEFAPFGEVIKELMGIRDTMAKLYATFHQGRMIQEGVQLSLVGSPNVGKSSLMNALLGHERAIVSPIAGTTRDLVEDDLRLSGLHLRLIDTAGIRETSECIEEEGIKRTKKAIDRSDLILFVLDATQEAHDAALIEVMPRDRCIAVWNKMDLIRNRPELPLPFTHIVEVSATTGMGLPTLLETIDSIIWGQQVSAEKDEVMLTCYRHKESLAAAIQAIDKVIQGLQTGISAEFVTFDMREALVELGTIIGTDIGEDVLTSIFSQFCIGK